MYTIVQISLPSSSWVPPSIRVPSSRLHSTLSCLLFLAPVTETCQDVNSLRLGTYMTNEKRTAHKSVVKGTNRERALRTVQQSSVAPHRPTSGRMGPYSSDQNSPRQPTRVGPCRGTKTVRRVVVNWRRSGPSPPSPPDLGGRQRRRRPPPTAAREER
jgi:hypothetical protein